MGRTRSLRGALTLIALLAFLTIDVMINHGVDILVIASLIVLALLGSALGALLTAPPDD